MEMIMNEENDWDHIVEGNPVEGAVDCVQLRGGGEGVK